MPFDPISLLATHVPRAAAPCFPDMLWRLSPADPDDRVAYLTFDDGPTHSMTGPLLELLARFDARATFFMLGEQVERLPHLARATVEAGHEIGNHTYSHPDAWRTRTPTLLRELERTTALLEQTLGRAVPWMRPPYGRFTGPMRAWCRLRRQRMAMWDVMPGDWLLRTTREDVIRRVTRLVRPGSLVVLHDNPRAVDATLGGLPVVLERLAAEGWRFAALPHTALAQRLAA